MKWLGPIAIFLAILTLLYWGAVFFWPGPRAVSNEDLVRRALEADTPVEREKAAVELSTRGKSARPNILELLKKSQHTEVRGACIRGLAEQWDYHSMALLLGLLDDPAVPVRDQASQAVIHLLHADYGYKADASAAERAPCVEQLRKTWEEYKRSKRHLAYMRQQMGEDFNPSKESAL